MMSDDAVVCDAGFRHDRSCADKESEVAAELVSAPYFKEYICWYACNA